MSSKLLVGVLASAVAIGCAPRGEDIRADRDGGGGKSGFAHDDPNPGGTPAERTGTHGMTEGQRFAQQEWLSNTLGIKLAQLAQQKATDPQVEEFAHRLQNDHERANQQLLAAAGSDATRVDALSIDPENLVQKLERLDGAQFDRQYVEQVVALHERNVATLERQTQSFNDYVNTEVPNFRRHLDEARRLRDTMRDRP